MEDSIKDGINSNSDRRVTPGRGELFCRNFNFTVFNIIIYWRSQF